MDLPLSGRTIVVTRARAQAAPLAAALEGLGARTLQYAAIRTEPLDASTPLRGALARLRPDDWVVFTSANGVECFFASAGAALPGGVRVCAIGAVTADALARNGVRADLVPNQFVAEAAAEALLAAGVAAGTRVLLARAASARPVLPQVLGTHGAEVMDVAVYRTVPDGSGAEEVRRALDAGEVDAVTFASGSAVASFADRVGTTLGRARAASIGPATSTALRERGIRVDVEADEHTIPGLVRALVNDLGVEQG